MLLIFKLIIGHAIADFALQSDAMANNKNRNIPKAIPYSPSWQYWLIAHSLIHAGVVWIVTGSAVFGIVELICHYVIDLLKCDRHINTHEDQFLHILCKVLYYIMS